MKQTLIKITNDHYVVVDNSEIKEGDWCLYKNKFGGQFICQAYVYERTLMFDDGSFNRSLGEGITPQKDECKKITHSTQPNKGMENVTFISPREVKELIGEVDVSKKAAELAFSRRIKFGGAFNSGVCDGLEEGYELGYNQALEDNKDKKYTLEDMKCMFQCGRNYQNNAEITFKVSMEYLQHKTEWEVTFDKQGKLRLI